MRATISGFVFDGGGVSIAFFTAGFFCSLSGRAGFGGLEVAGAGAGICVLLAFVGTADFLVSGLAAPLFATPTLTSFAGFAVTAFDLLVGFDLAAAGLAGTIFLELAAAGFFVATVATFLAAGLAGAFAVGFFAVFEGFADLVTFLVALVAVFFVGAGWSFVVVFFDFVDKLRLLEQISRLRVFYPQVPGRA
jgi:hypothetical protein